MEWKLAYAFHNECSKVNICTIEELEKSGFEIIPAEVPGNFELDMMCQGKIEDLFFSTNTWKAQDLEAMHVWYYTKFDIEKQSQYLHFEGIDTFADIYVNGNLVMSTDNMFLSYDVSADWYIGENEVVVHIKPTMLEARKFVSPVACNSMDYEYPSLCVRKAAHMFGWDIMPRIVSAGIWKEVSLLDHKDDRINEVYITTYYVDIKNGMAGLRFYVNANLSGQYAKEYKIRLEGHCKESSFSIESTLWHNTQAFNFGIENCKFWWPRNMGDANLYDTTVTLLHGARVCDTYRLQVGVRTAELLRTDYTDGDGNGEFCFKINGKKAFVLGTNWVPLNAFHSQDNKRLNQALELVEDIGCNMIRCWGGNVYESDAFFEYCDAHGIMIWQDFAMGCAVYPQEKSFMERLEKEVIYQIKRLRNHASLVLWAGDNEDDYAYQGWSGTRRNPNRNSLTREFLPKLIENHDYNRTFLPSSPYISEAVFQGKGIMPEDHLWGPRDYFKGDYYKNTFCHFASEIGYHGFPSVKSLKKFLRNPEIIFNQEGAATDEYIVHASSMEPSPAPFAYRIQLAYDQVVTLFGKAEENLADFVCQSQISQAEAKKYFIEKFRIAKWKRTGIIWWNLLDGWPQVSDAVVDYYFTKKLAYHYIKRSQERVCLMFDEPLENRISLFGVNELPSKCVIDYTVSRIIPHAENEILLKGRAILEEESSVEITKLPIGEREKSFYLIEWELEGKKFKNHYFTNIIDINYKEYMDALKKCGMDEFDM